MANIEALPGVEALMLGDWISPADIEAARLRTIEELSRNLQGRLEAFAAMSPQEQRNDLGNLIALIKHTATHEVITHTIEGEDQTRLEQAIALTLETPIDFDGKVNIPWAGSYTVVALDANGKIRGAVSQRPDDMTEYGSPDYNFFPPALVKALVSLHLYKAGLNGGIGDNRRYLQSITHGEFSYHMGATDEPTSVNGNDIYLGASGCEALPSVVSLILEGAITTHFTQAGRFDAAFAGVTAQYLDYSGQRIKTMTSPVIDRLTAGN